MCFKASFIAVIEIFSRYDRNREFEYQEKVGKGGCGLEVRVGEG